MTHAASETPDPGRPVVFRNGIVLTMDDAHTVLADGDVLVVDDRIAAVGQGLEVPEGTQEIDARGGIVMPGMIDTHRHMWQTAMRGYGADWTLTQYFVWYYLEHGNKFRPEDIFAGNLALRLGIARGRGHHHGRLVARACRPSTTPMPPSTRSQSVPGRFVLAYGNIQAAPWEWTADPAVRAFFERRRAGSDDMLGFQLAFDVTGDPAFPEKAAFEVARELALPVTTHAGVWGATNDDGIRLMHENGFATPDTVYVHAATLTTDSYQRIAASGGSVSVSTESEQSAGQGYPPTWQVRRHDIPVSLSMDTSVWWSGDLFSAMRTTLGADRSREHLEAHAKGDTVTHVHLRAEQVVDWATRGGARALGRDDIGQPRARPEGRRGPAEERLLARVVPAAQPLWPCRVPGTAGRRPHGAGQRPRREARSTRSSASTFPPCVVRSRQPWTTSARRSARRRGRRE